MSERSDLLKLKTKACALILTHLDQINLTLVMNESDPTKIWNKLNEYHGKALSTSKIRLRRECGKFQMKNNDLSSYIRDCELLIQKMVACDILKKFLNFFKD